MATIEKPMILPRIVKSATTAQYYLPRTRPSNFYVPRFVLDKERFGKHVSQKYIKDTDPMMPPYPYGKDNRFPEANLGLYGGATIQSGHKISKGRNKGKTLRKWFPNIKMEKLESKYLNHTFSMPVTARVKRTIAKCGGLDQYLLGDSPSRIKELGLMGWKLRWSVMRSEKYLQTVGEEKRKALTETFEDVWADPVRRQELLQRQAQKWATLKDKDERFRQHFQTLLIGDKARNSHIPKISTLNLINPTLLNYPSVVEEEAVPRGRVPQVTGKKNTKQSPSLSSPATSSLSSQLAAATAVPPTNEERHVEDMAKVAQQAEQLEQNKT